MEARNRRLDEWFMYLRTGQIMLPRFQRHEAWGHQEVSSLLESVLRGLPTGATLILEVADKPPFEERVNSSVHRHRRPTWPSTYLMASSG